MFIEVPLFQETYEKHEEFHRCSTFFKKKKPTSSVNSLKDSLKMVWDPTAAPLFFDIAISNYI